MITEQDIEKIIYRAIMKTWHTAKRKPENARNVAIVAANDIWNTLQMPTHPVIIGAEGAGAR